MDQVYEFGPFRLDTRSGRLFRASTEVHLTAKGYAMLVLLAERAGSLVGRDEILAAVWPEGFVEPANLTQTIYVLRKTLADSETLIETVPGRGYRFTAAVRRRPHPTSVGALRARLSAARIGTLVWPLAVALIALSTLALHSSVPSAPAKTALDVQAQRDYILGRHYWSERSASGLHRGLQYFQSALRISPNYAQAYSGLADSYSALGYYDAMGTQKKRYFTLARAAALRAIAIDPGLPEPHASLAFADEMCGSSYRGEVAKEFQRSIQLDGTYATAHHWYSWFLFWQGDKHAALEQMTQAHDLDPLSPIINFALGYQLFYVRQFNDAAAQWHQTISIEPYSPEGYYGAGLTDEQLGHHDLAVREFKHALRLSPNDPDVMSGLAYVYAKVRQPDVARWLLSRMTKMKPVPAFDVAVVNEALGQRTQAIKWLAIARLHSDSDRLEISLDPRLDNLRYHPATEAIKNATHTWASSQG